MHRIGQIDQRVFPDIVDAHEIRLYIRVEESLICPLGGPDVVGAAAFAAAPSGSASAAHTTLDDAKIRRFLHKNNTYVPPYGPRLPYIRMRVGPARQFAGHFSPRRDRSIHSHGTECAEQRSVEQWPPACEEDTPGARRHVDQAPHANILF